MGVVRLKRSFKVTACLLAGLLWCCCVMTSSALWAQTPDSTIMAADSTLQPETALPIAPPSDLRAVDSDNDPGHAIALTWTVSPDDAAGRVMTYAVFRSSFPDSGFVQVGVTPSGSSSFEHRGGKKKTDPDYFPNDSNFYYQVAAVGLDTTQRSFSAPVGPIQATGQWFNTGRIPTFIGVILFAVFTFVLISAAKRGADLYIRPIAGVEAVDEAIGRATEMGKPILYLCGAGAAEEIATIASMTILSRVSKRVAEYQTQIIVPAYDPVVMTMAQEVVRGGYMDAGRADSHNPDSVFFVTQSQFSYVAAVNGIMLRERPATNVYMGKFYAESLIFAETGSQAGSIQIAGTDETAQLPFFVVACDYTLIGEELFAASAYLGREPVLLGSLKAQDYMKAAVIIAALLGMIAVNMSALGMGDGFGEFKNWFRVLN